LCALRRKMPCNCDGPEQLQYNLIGITKIPFFNNLDKVLHRIAKYELIEMGWFN
jgi:hypothetical protein